MDPKPKNQEPMIAKAQTVSSGASVRRSSRPGGGAKETDPDSLLDQIRQHLGQGRYRTAQQLAKEAAVRFPRHKGIGTMHRGLNKRRASTRPADGHSRKKEFAWLRNPPESARGQLVALVDGEMVASAQTMSELTTELKAMNLSKMPLVHRIEG